MCREIATIQNIFVTNLSFEASDQRAIDNPSHKSRDCHHCCHNSCLGFVITRMEAMVMLIMLLCSAIMTRMLIVCISVACLVCAVVGATHHLKYSDRSIGIAMVT